MKTFYITTPIYYPNAVPHLGHAYTTVYADILARYHRLKGDETFFLTGTDEHGLKLQRAAEKKGIHPKEFVDEMAERYKNYWSLLDISYDRFIRTTDPDHEELVKWALKKLYEKGLIYKAKYPGWYCVDCEKFYSEGEYEVIEGKPHCPIHKKPLEWLEEETYYFKLSEFTEFLQKTLKRDIVYPRQYAQEVLGKIEKEGLLDVSLARPKSRVWWGIPLPWDEEYTTYVWFDALLNYVTGAGYLRDPEKFNKLWANTHHVIGKDILWFHTAIWFSMLEALEIPLPRKVLVHAFLINRGLKMGKSAGNVVFIEDLLQRYQDSDGLRYIIARIFNLQKDIEVSTDLFDSIYNSDLADNYGNLVRRVGTLVKRRLNGKLTAGKVDEDVQKTIEKTIEEYTAAMNSYEVSRAVEHIMDLLRRANAYMNESKPWEKQAPVNELYTVMEAVRTATIMLHPIIPKSTTRVAKAFGFQINYNALSTHLEEYNVTEAPILFRKVKRT
ncbi:MAG: methionine--tRNA ligase [Desulfurococcales archaeon]|nr:methionine--tRNA ligase [Desulfurococcales archaeon]